MVASDDRDPNIQKQKEEKDVDVCGADRPQQLTIDDESSLITNATATIDDDERMNGQRCDGCTKMKSGSVLVTNDAGN